MANPLLNLFYKTPRPYDRHETDAQRIPFGPIAAAPPRHRYTSRVAVAILCGPCAHGWALDQLQHGRRIRTILVSHVPITIARFMLRHGTVRCMQHSHRHCVLHHIRSHTSAAEAVERHSTGTTSFIDVRQRRAEG